MSRARRRMDSEGALQCCPGHTPTPALDTPAAHLLYFAGVANAEAATSLSAATATSNARTAPRFSADARVRAVPPIAPGAIPEARPVAAPHTSRTTDASPSMTAAPARGPQALFAVLAAAAAAAAFAVWNRLRRPATPLSSQAIHVPLEECRIAMAATTGTPGTT